MSASVLAGSGTWRLSPFHAPSVVWPCCSHLPLLFSSVCAGAGSGTLDPESLQIWTLKAVTPLVGFFTWESGARYQEIGLPELTAFTKVRRLLLVVGSPAVDSPFDADAAAVVAAVVVVVVVVAVFS